MNYQLTFEANPLHSFTKAELNDFETLDSETFASEYVEKYLYNEGWFVNKGYLQWEEWQKDRLAFLFAETQRDNGYIFLYDFSRNIWVALPINGGRSYYAYGGNSNWTDLYDVRKAPTSGTEYGSPEFRARVNKVLQELPPYPEEITSNGPKRNIFTKMTDGLTHEKLLDAWNRGKKLTSCNAFTGWFARSMGSKKYLGRFDLDTLAKSAWIPATSGRTPKYGDILRFQAFHVGIALDFVNGALNTAEGGQGGPLRRFDAIGRKKRNWDPTKFMGWVDLEKWIQNGG